MLTWDSETRRRKNTCSVFVCPSPEGINAASETEMTGASSDFKNILNMETNQDCSNLARMAVRRGGLGQNLDLSFCSECVTLCGLTEDRNNGNRTTVTRNVTKEKKNLFARWQASCEQEGEEAKGHTDEAEQMRKIVRYRKNAVPEPELHPNGGRRGSRRKQAAT